MVPTILSQGTVTSTATCVQLHKRAERVAAALTEKARLSAGAHVALVYPPGERAHPTCWVPPPVSTENLLRVQPACLSATRWLCSPTPPFYYRGAYALVTTNRWKWIFAFPGGASPVLPCRQCFSHFFRVGSPRRGFLDITVRLPVFFKSDRFESAFYPAGGPLPLLTPNVTASGAAQGGRQGSRAPAFPAGNLNRTFWLPLRSPGPQVMCWVISLETTCQGQWPVTLTIPQGHSTWCSCHFSLTHEPGNDRQTLPPLVFSCPEVEFLSARHSEPDSLLLSMG